MRTSMANTRRPACYTVRDAAWILGVEPSRISRSIRVGTLRTERRHGCLVIPASALTRLLGARANHHAANTEKPRAERSRTPEHSPQHEVTP